MEYKSAYVSSSLMGCPWFMPLVSTDSASGLRRSESLLSWTCIYWWPESCSALSHVRWPLASRRIASLPALACLARCTSSTGMTAGGMMHITGLHRSHGEHLVLKGGKQETIFLNNIFNCSTKNLPSQWHSSFSSKPLPLRVSEEASSLSQSSLYAHQSIWPEIYTTVPKTLVNKLFSIYS